MSKTNIVISRYRKNVDFINKLNCESENINIMIYDKVTPSNPLNIPVNKGNEASVYLKYIVDFYDDLPEFTFFMHDEEYAWHHTGSIIDKYYEAKNSNKLYYNVNDKCLWDKCEIIKPNIYKILLQWYDKFIEPYIPFARVPNNKDFTYGYRGSAQFLVHRDIISKLPKKFYQDLYDWIITTHLKNSLSGRYLEFTWHIFWDIYPNL